MVRLHGNAPYKYVLVHGGPGAVGSLRGFAEELSRSSKEGVVEAIQSKYSIDGLIEELYRQIRENCTDRVFLIGHSWGAWLSVLTAERYPEVVEAMTLVGCLLWKWSMSRRSCPADLRTCRERRGKYSKGCWITERMTRI